MTELVFSLVLRRVWIRQRIAPAAWASAALTCVAVSVFIAAAEPQGGTVSPSSPCVGVLDPGVRWECRRAGAVGGEAPRPAVRPCSRPQPRTVWALEATFIKAMTDTLTEYGVAGTFVRWPVYAVAVGGVAGTLLVELALHVGPLRVSQPLLVIVDPVISIVLSLHLFGERFTADAAHLAFAAAAFLAMCGGVVLLTMTVPETMEAKVPGGPL